MPHATADEIASLVLEQFERLPAKRKPAVRDNGIHEWVPLSGIVAEVDGSLHCLSLATGMKCLPASKLPLANGTALHDWHAEILALRAFNHFLLSECQAVASGRPSLFIRRRTSLERTAHNHPVWQGQPFALHDSVVLHMYCSEAPCGDASMELTMAAQPDASPWALPAAPSSPSSPDDPTASLPLLPGRAYFSALGTVRRKPARADAAPTLSKSCSDKLALRQCASLLAGPTALLVRPSPAAYLASLVLPAARFSAAACARSFSPAGRMRAVAEDAGAWQAAGYAFVPFEVRTTALEFRFARGRVAGMAGEAVGASNLAAAWARDGLEEGLVGGGLQGRRQFDARGASAVSRRRMWAFALEVAGMEGVEGGEIERELRVERYGDVKEGGLLEGRRRVKDAVRGEALTGWVRNVGDESFGLV